MKKPNFLIILVDQQRYDTIAAAGYPWMKTPNMDRIVNEGCLFKNAYTTNPICVPARYDLLTGRHAKNHQHFDNDCVFLDEGLATIPRVFSENGWRTAALGKSHFTPVLAHHGYDERQIMEEISTQVEDDAYLKYLRDQGHGDLRNMHGVRPLSYHTPQKALVPEEDLGPAWLGRTSADWIDRHHDHPFLLTLGWIKPHPPWNIPESKKGLYADVDLPEPLEASRDLPYRSEKSDLYGDFDSPAEKRKIREAYFESISLVDDAIGNVLDALERNGILDDTVIIFTADHGEMLQDKGFYQKMLPYDSSCRIPLAVRYPERFEPGSMRHEFADLLDIFPTLLDIAGIDLSYNPNLAGQTLDGESLLTNDSPKRKIQFSHSGQGSARWVMTRDERYKYIYYFAGGHEYLYDLPNDPAEKSNLLGTTHCPTDVFEKLKSEAIRREKLTGPDGTVDHDALIPQTPLQHPHFNWGNGEKYPKWCFLPAHFQQFGTKSSAEEANLFLDEFVRSREGQPPFHCPPEAKPMLLDAYQHVWGTDPADLEKLLDS